MGFWRPSSFEGVPKSPATEHDQQEIRDPAEQAENNLETQFVQPCEERNERGQINSQPDGAIDNACHGGPDPPQHDKAGEKERHQHEKDDPEEVSRWRQVWRESQSYC